MLPATTWSNDGAVSVTFEKTSTDVPTRTPSEIFVPRPANASAVTVPVTCVDTLVQLTEERLARLAFSTVTAPRRRQGRDVQIAVGVRNGDVRRAAERPDEGELRRARDRRRRRRGPDPRLGPLDVRADERAVRVDKLGRAGVGRRGLDGREVRPVVVQVTEARARSRRERESDRGLRGERGRGHDFRTRTLCARWVVYAGVSA